MHKLHKQRDAAMSGVGESASILTANSKQWKKNMFAPHDKGLQRRLNAFFSEEYCKVLLFRSQSSQSR